MERVSAEYMLLSKQEFAVYCTATSIDPTIVSVTIF